MPWKSDAQRRWGNSPAGHKALGDAGVAEWNSATKGKSLPSKLAQGGPAMPMSASFAPSTAPAGVAPSDGAGPARGTFVNPPPPDNKGYQASPVRMATGGPVLGRSRSFMKIPDEFTGGRLPPKQTAPAKQEYGSKGAQAKRTGDKSLSAVKPRK